MNAVIERKPSPVRSKLQMNLTSGLNEDALLADRLRRSDPWDHRIQDLQALSDLGDDWDGQGALAPSAELVDSAIKLAWLLRQKGDSAPGRVAPGVNGTIILEWQENGEFREIEVIRPFYAEVMRVVPGQPAEHGVITNA